VLFHVNRKVSFWILGDNHESGPTRQPLMYIGARKSPGARPLICHRRRRHSRFTGKRKRNNMLVPELGELESKVPHDTREKNLRSHFSTELNGDPQDRVPDRLPGSKNVLTV